MNNKELKQLRGQLRQIVKELLPEILNTEALLNLDKKLTNVVINRLDKIDERQKDLQSYFIRATTSQTPVDKK